MDRRAPGLRIYRSNRLERLAAALGERLAIPTGDAFAPECILVPGRGVAQWLGFELASSFGIWANVLYLYPRNFVAWALERVLGKPLEELQAFDPDRLLWSVCATLPTLFEHPEFDAIARYVSGDARDVRFFELCRRIASTFDRYAAYRPDLLANWERKPRGGGGNEPAPQLALFTASDDVGGWQPILWRALLERSGSVPAGSLERSFLRNLRQASRIENLPARISCFGVTHLPPTYSRILVALGAHVPVDVFQLSASESAAVRAAEVPLKGSLPRPGTGATRNPLLSSLGTLASDFESVLADELARQSVPNESHALYETPVGHSRLSRLQRQILSDQRPASGARERESASRVDDDSICIHVCHSPMREVEVLYDQLLALLSSGAGYEPRDIVVLTPDIETYAPLIEAVFRRAIDDPGRIPYTIADRTLEASAPVATALDRLFGLAGQRLSTSQVLDLLALEVIASRFDIGPRDHEQITEWLTQTNVRWGVDAEHRQAHGHPSSDANTWQLGLRRLFLGYAMSSDPPVLVSGVLPESGATGTEAATLGKLAAFLTTLFAHVALIGTPRPMQAWPEAVAAALDALVTSDADNAWQHDELRDCLATLGRRSDAAGYRDPVSSAALRELLFDLAEQARPARGFLMGGITFCSMVPLRSLPFRAVCLLGLGDGQFPRKELSADFDLMVHGGEGRRVGDRSRRSEDRYIFLEAILAARERLLITYTGQSIRDNSVLPPSVVVSELSDYLQASEPAPAETGAKTQPSYVVRHPLQAFSPRYFDGSDPRLFSYASHPLGAPSAGRLQPSLEFFSGPLPTMPDTEPVALGDLVRFYQNPTAYLLNRRLELFLREQHQDLGDREPQELAPLDKFSAGQDLLELLRRGVDPTAALQLLRATSALPLGSPGELDFRELAAAARRIAGLEQETRQGARQPPRSVRAALPGGRHLFGVLPEAYDNGLCEPQFARVRARHLLRTWILHLAYCWLGADGTPTEPGRLRAPNASQSTLIGRSLVGSGAVLHQFAAVREPAQHLQRLVLRYQEGLCEPLRLFPSTSHAFAAWQRKPTKKDDLQTVLEKEWQQESAHDAHLERVFGARRPFSELRPTGTGPGFDALALEVFEPLLEHLTSSEHDRVRAFSVTDIPLWGRNLVDASAGTGKTYAIATLFVRLLLETEHQPRQLLVVTFTEAATAELKDRVRARLRECLVLATASEPAASADPTLLALLRRAGDRPRAKQRLEQALYAFDEVEISTIHGFCQRVLMERAFQSDLSYGAELYGDARPLIDELILDFWALHAGPAEPELLAFMRSEGNKFNLEAARRLAYAVQRAPQVRLLPELPKEAPLPDFTRFRRELERVRGVWQQHDVAGLVEAGGVRKQIYNRKHLPAWTAEVSDFFACDPGLFLALPKCFERFCSERLRQAGATTLLEHEVVQACDALAAEYRLLERALGAEVLRFKLSLLEYIRTELPRRTSQLGQLSFDDLLSKLHAALSGRSGAELALGIRKRYPVALIDEFQDTDPVQLEIFERIYAGPNTSLFLIGDPKQAIYSFRGADVFSYVHAAESTAPERHFTMTTNYRSDPSLVAAVNHLFVNCPRPFLMPEIGFAPVDARPGASDVLTHPDGSNASGLEILFAEASPEQALDAEWVARQLPRLVAEDIRGALEAGPTTALGALRPGDIAVLTRTNDQAFQIQAALRASGVASVVLGDKSVYDSTEARDLERLLAAVVEPSNARLIRAALASELVGVTANELARMDEEDGEWEHWLSTFQELAAVWAQTGFVHMCRELLARHGVEQHLLSLGDGERRMTNLLQLIELLHGASVRSHLGPSGLLHYLGQQRRRGLIGMEAESAQIRLESDAEAVKITTMHKSKGLEYPVVYCPYLWHGLLLLPSDEQAPKLHLADGRLAIDIGSSERPEHVLRARWEQFAENLRLAYVALTRARHRCSVVWGRIGRYASSALGYLLHPLPPSEAPADVATIQTHLANLDNGALLSGLERHAAAASIRVRALSAGLSPVSASDPSVADSAEPLSEPEAVPVRLVARVAAARIDDHWRSSSFSALTSHSATARSGEEHLRDHDAAALPALALSAPIEPPDALALTPAPLRLAEFPRGATAGSFFHEILEHYDFTSPRSEALERLVAGRLGDYHYPSERWLEPVSTQVLAVLDTPLGASASEPGVRLADVPLTRRLTELEFCVPVAHGRSAGRGPALEARALGRVFREHPSDALSPEYADTVSGLGFVPLRGYLRGFIDSVFQDGERFFVVDYKGNHLGARARDYGPSALRTAMLEGQYFLQYHLYALAVHRYLGRRIPNYDFERHFGGVYYLFLRGMGPEHGDSGVFYEKPPLARLNALSRLLAEAT